MEHYCLAFEKLKALVRMVKEADCGFLSSLDEKEHNYSTCIPTRKPPFAQYKASLDDYRELIVRFETYKENKDIIIYFHHTQTVDPINSCFVLSETIKDLPEFLTKDDIGKGFSLIFGQLFQDLEKILSKKDKIIESLSDMKFDWQFTKSTLYASEDFSDAFYLTKINKIPYCAHR